MTTSEPFGWTRELAGQLAWYWQHLMQPRLTGLTDEDSMAALVLHIHRELFHHAAEIALLRNLYRAGPSQPVDGLATASGVSLKWLALRR